MKRKLAIVLGWLNQSEYYSQELAEAISDQYETTLTSKNLDWTNFDIIMVHFASSRPGCAPCKLVKRFAAFNETNWRLGAVNIAPSSLIWRRLLVRDPEAMLIPHGVRPEDFFPQPFPNGKLIVGWAGPNTGPKRLLRLRSLIESIDNVKFFPAQWAASRPGVYTGLFETRNMGQFYSQIHIYACASRSEGFGFPLLEASACGRAVVTFDVGVARDLKATGAGIVIVDSFEEMKEAIVSMDYCKLGEMSAQAIRDHWLWKNVRDKWLEAFARVK